MGSPTTDAHICGVIPVGNGVPAEFGTQSGSPDGYAGPVKSPAEARAGSAAAISPAASPSRTARDPRVRRTFLFRSHCEAM